MEQMVKDHKEPLRMAEAALDSTRGKASSKRADKTADSRTATNAQKGSGK